MVWPSHVRLSITRHLAFSELFASAHEARRSTKHAPITRAPKARRPFLSLRSSFNSWPFIYAFFAGGLCERFFCASSNRLARVCICFDELLRIPSSVRWIVSPIFGRAPSPHLAVSVSDIEEEKAQRNRIIESRICDNQQSQHGIVELGHICHGERRGDGAAVGIMG